MEQIISLDSAKRLLKKGTGIFTGYVQDERHVYFAIIDDTERSLTCHAEDDDREIEQEYPDMV
jgi:hypothetical protein